MSNVFLIGLMGVGKSTIGAELARVLGVNFLDTDQTIEDVSGRTISELFEHFGETDFRAREKALIEHFKDKNSIISTGGGLPCHDGLVEKMKEKGRVVYLKLDPENLAKRLWVKRRNRPLISTCQTMEELQRKLSNLLTQRERFYLQADFVLEVKDKASCEIVDELVELLK